MARRTQTFEIIPWVGGINTSVDSGMMNPQELVLADNVQCASSGARIKRNAFEYLDEAVPAPDFRSSSGTTRTLKWTTNALVNITSLNERLVNGERITVAGVTNYNATDVAISSRTSIQQVTSVTCVADIAGSLAGKYFLLSAGDEGTNYYVWYQVSGSGADPAISGRQGLMVAITTGDTNSAVATATATAIDGLTDFAASPSSAVVTVTNALGGITTDGSAGNSGFTVSVTTKGGHSVTYTAGSSLSESLTAAGGITVARASKIIGLHDYWRYASGNSKSQLLIFCTDDFQLFSLDDSGRRVQVHGQEQVSKVTTIAASGITSGDYFLLNRPNGQAGYYVWYNKDSGGGDPAVAGRTAVPVVIAGGDTDAQVATATQSAIDALSDYSASVSTNEVTITETTSGVTDETVDVNTGFTFTTLKYGATAPTTAINQVCMGVMNEDLILSMSGLGNLMITYNPDRDAKYQLLFANINSEPIGPDASFFFFWNGRMWCDDKTERDYLHYSETFDQTIWYGFGDSGALPIQPGDGDPEGIICGYTFKGFGVVGKKSKRYRIVGDSPENYQVVLISEGLGTEGQLAIPVDESDVVFVSRRGFHSQQATDAYGDTDAQYLSADIKGSFNDFEAEGLKYTQGAYIPELNSIAFSIRENGQQENNAIWIYNIEAQVPGKQRPGIWYRWPDVSCTALSRRFTNNKWKIVIGTEDGRIIQAQKEEDFADFGTEAIPFRLRSGTIYPNNDPVSIKAFKRISMIYRPRGNFTFTVRAKIDNQVTQAWPFNQISGLDLLGETFILGSSTLGSSNTLAPFTFTMEGMGRGIVLEVEQNSADEQVEIWGFVIEYEGADLRQSADEESA